MSATRLWEAEHPYYSSGQHQESYASWDDFLAEMGDADDDLNLVFRWDWCEGSDHDLPDGQVEVRISYVHQRKGYASRHDVKVTRKQEPIIRAWLEQKHAYLQRNWNPIGATP